MHWPTLHRRASLNSSRYHPAIAWLCIFAGTWPIAVAVGLVDVPPERVVAPNWVLALAGAAFVIGGSMMLLRERKRLLDGLAGILMLAFCAVGAWAALFAPAASISGGLPFVPRAVNVAIGRTMFGLGAIITLSIAVYAFRLAWRGR